MEYNNLGDYYRSDRWQTLRREVYRFYNYKCGVCQSDWKARGDYLVAHHTRYWLNGESILGKESISRDMACVCNRHHERGAFSKEQIAMRRKSYRFRMIFAGLWSIIVAFVRFVWRHIARIMKTKQNR